jgi:hypothetical protein
MINSNLVNAASAEMAAAKKSDSLDRIVIPTDIREEEKVIPTEYNVVFKLVKPKKGRTWLDNCCDNVPNPNKNNVPERIWLLNGAHSIWDSEIENLLKDKDRYNRARRGRDIVFIDGVCRVNSTDALMLEFMRKSKKNVGSKRGGNGSLDFYEYNPAVEQEERHKKQLIKVQMVVKAGELDCSENGYGRKLAAFLGITMTDPELGIPKSAKEIQTELMLRADSDPATFQKHIDSKEVEVSWLVRKAIVDNKIDLGGDSRNVTWASGKGFITKRPADRKAYEYLTELALTNSDEGRKFLENLKTAIA